MAVGHQVASTRYFPALAFLVLQSIFLAFSLKKVPEVKDTIHKHSLLYHMTYWVLEKFPDSGDLYSELGPVTR